MESSQVNEILKPLLLGWSILGKRLSKSSAKSIKLKEKKRFWISLLHTALALQDEEKISVIDKLLDEAIGSVRKPQVDLP